MDLLNAQRQVSSQQVQSTAASLAIFGCLLISSPSFGSPRRDLNTLEVLLQECSFCCNAWSLHPGLVSVSLQAIRRWYQCSQLRITATSRG